MKHFTLGTIFGVALGLFLAGVAVQAQCCAMLDVPLDTQIEMEHQQLTGGWDTPHTPPHTNQDLWRESFLKDPCR